MYNDCFAKSSASHFLMRLCAAATRKALQRVMFDVENSREYKDEAHSDYSLFKKHIDYKNYTFSLHDKQGYTSKTHPGARLE